MQPLKRYMACQNIGRSQIKLSKPAKSANQQKAARASLSAKHGGKPKSKLKGASKSMITSMTEKQLEELTATKRTRKPEHVQD